LSELGISPDEIKLIYLTHFHGDHIGGLITAAENEQISKVFANADIYASQTEYDAWMNDISNNDLQKNIMGLYQDKLHLFTFGETLPHNVAALDAVGHTPGHTAYRYNELLIIGDLMHGYALQKDHPEINSIYDMDKDKSAQSRIRLMKYAQDNHLIMAGMHLPEPGFIQ
jgi:glyoxylase-like metal-dependent hydrolase (beta-lactamase superfamily II)